MDATRIKALKQAMKRAGMHALFVSNPKNVKYLTGFKTTMPGDVQCFGDPEGFVLVHAKRCDFLCDGRYIEGAGHLPGVRPQLLESPVSAPSIAAKIKQLLPKGVKKIGFEQDAMLYSDGLGLAKHLRGLKLLPADALFAALRVCKSPEEVKLIQKAQAITGACFKHVLPFIRPGMSEHQLALKIDDYLRTHGEGTSFATIVSFGETSCQPHYTPDPRRKLKKGQIVLMDFGAVYNGYCGDMTRMAFMGKADARYREVYKIVLEAQLNCIAAVKPGAVCHDLDMIVRKTFERYGCLDRFLHGTGHGVGLAIHEEPRLKKSFKTKVRPGMVFSVEPGLYYPGWGGVRVEDLVAVTERGHKNLTTATKEIIEL